MCMKRRSFLRSSAALVGAGILGSGDSHADHLHPHSVHAASLMTECAQHFLAALDAGQRGKATFPFDTDERMNWHFIPKERKGLPLREMRPYQRHLASALLAAGLSQTGYIKAVTIMSLEDVLKIMENDSGENRNTENARNVAAELAENRIAQINQAGRNIYFAWSGGINRGDPHYYRVQTPLFLVELDDTQDDANHIHSVWRDVTGDFGNDVLQQHYEANHQ